MDCFRSEVNLGRLIIARVVCLFFLHAELSAYAQGRMHPLTDSRLQALTAAQPAVSALKPLVVAKVLQRHQSIKGCKLWRPSQFRSKHSLVSTQRRPT